MPRRKRDGAIVIEPTLWDGEHDGFRGAARRQLPGRQVRSVRVGQGRRDVLHRGLSAVAAEHEATPTTWSPRWTSPASTWRSCRTTTCTATSTTTSPRPFGSIPTATSGRSRSRRSRPSRSPDRRAAPVRGDFGFRAVFFQRAWLRPGRERRPGGRPEFGPFWERGAAARRGRCTCTGSSRSGGGRQRRGPLPGDRIVHTMPNWNFPREGIGRMPREGKIHLRQDIRELLALPNVGSSQPIAYGALSPAAAASSAASAADRRPQVEGWALGPPRPILRPLVFLLVPERFVASGAEVSRRYGARRAIWRRR